MTRKENFHRKIKMNDCIHEHMEFEPLIIRIIDTPQFQRLRHIKQIGPAYRVFPSAAHNRFEHCLGVCHLAGVMLDSLERNTPNFKSITQNYERKRLCVRIAGLCHDLGHGPFSHTWEHFVTDPNWTHEDLSVQMLRQIFKELPDHGIEDSEIELIQYFIKGVKYPVTNPYFIEHPEDLYLAEIVNNQFCDIDVDKWDYILRDSKQVNMPTGFDYKRLLTGVRITTIKDTKQTHVSYRETDAINIYRMYMERANLHYYCYKHKTSLILQAMVLDAFREADSEIILKDANNDSRCLSKAHENLNIYTQLTDNILEKILWELPKSKGSLIVQRIIKRDLYNILYAHKFYNNERHKFKEIMKQKDEILSKIQITGGKVILNLDIMDKTFRMGNGELTMNAVFHNKTGENVDIIDFQLFKQNEDMKDLFYGELIIYCKNSKDEIDFSIVTEEIKKQFEQQLQFL